MIDKFLTKVFGSSNQRYLKSLGPTVAQINALEPDVKRLSDVDQDVLRELVKAGYEHINGQTFDSEPT